MRLSSAPTSLRTLTCAAAAGERESRTKSSSCCRIGIVVVFSPAAAAAAAAAAASSASEKVSTYPLPYAFFRNNGVPSHTSSPPDMMPMRSPKRSASSIECVVSTMTRPAFFFLRRFHVARCAYTSMPEVGSSRKTTLAEPMKAIASCSFLFCPPLSDGASALILLSRPTSRSRSCTAASRSARGTPLSLPTRRRCSPTVSFS